MPVDLANPPKVNKRNAPQVLQKARERAAAARVEPIVEPEPKADAKPKKKKRGLLNAIDRALFGDDEDDEEEETSADEDSDDEEDEDE